MSSAWNLTSSIKKCPKIFEDSFLKNAILDFWSEALISISLLRISTKNCEKLRLYHVNPDSREVKDILMHFLSEGTRTIIFPIFLKWIQVERDFNLHEVFPANFFEGVFTEEESDHFYASFFNALVHKWGLTGQNNEKFDDLPFGNIGTVQQKIQL